MGRRVDENGYLIDEYEECAQYWDKSGTLACDKCVPDGCDGGCLKINPVETPFSKAVREGRLILEETGSDRRRSILAEVEKCVCKDRQNTYGDAEENFTDIADLVNVVLKNKLATYLDAEDIAVIHACTKLARIKSSPKHLDNWIDLAGYAVCGGGIVKAEQGSGS